MRGRNLKGQGQVGVAIVTAAIFLLVGLLVVIQVFQSTPITNLVVTNESLGNFTAATAGGDPGRDSQVFTVANSPIYVGPTVGQEANMTVTLQLADGSFDELTPTENPLIVNDSFTVLSPNQVNVTALNNGSLLAVYTQERAAAAYRPTTNNILSQTNSSFQLLAVGMIVLAAVFVLGFLFVMGRRG